MEGAERTGSAAGRRCTVLLEGASERPLRPERHFDTIASAVLASTGGEQALARLEGGSACGSLSEAGFQALEREAGGQGGACLGGAGGDEGGLPGGRGGLAPGGLAVVRTIEVAGDGRVRVRDVRGMLAGPAPGEGALRVALNGGAGPYLCRPLAMGADVVVEGPRLAGRALPGGGARPESGARPFVARTQAVAEEFAARMEALAGGGACGPMPEPMAEAISCGLPTLSLRAQRASDTALAAAHYLALHPLVGWASYPGMPDDPSNAAARRCLEHGFGPIVSFKARAGRLSEGAACPGEGGALSPTEASGQEGGRLCPAADGAPTSALALEGACGGALSTLRRGPAPGTYVLQAGLEDALDVVAALERLLGPVEDG